MKSARVLGGDGRGRVAVPFDATVVTFPLLWFGRELTDEPYFEVLPALRPPHDPWPR